MKQLKTYTPELREEAVKLVLAQGLTLEEAALRLSIPKGTDLSGYSQADLNKIALKLNQRPRKTLGFQTPASKLISGVALTG